MQTAFCDHIRGHLRHSGSPVCTLQSQLGTHHLLCSTVSASLVLSHTQPFFVSLQVSSDTHSLCVHITSPQGSRGFLSTQKVSSGTHRLLCPHHTRTHVGTSLSTLMPSRPVGLHTSQSESKPCSSSDLPADRGPLQSEGLPLQTLPASQISPQGAYPILMPFFIPSVGLFFTGLVV